MKNDQKTFSVIRPLMVSFVDSSEMVSTLMLMPLSIHSLLMSRLLESFCLCDILYHVLIYTAEMNVVDMVVPRDIKLNKDLNN